MIYDQNCLENGVSCAKLVPIAAKMAAVSASFIASILSKDDGGRGAIVAVWRNSEPVGMTYLAIRIRSAPTLRRIR